MRDATHYAENAERYAEIAPQLFAAVPLDLGAPTGGAAVAVHANHGRWVVTCPDCLGAQLTHASDRRFLCNLCGNVGNGRRFRPVSWPKDHEAIGALLDERSDPRLRNWSPGEIVADLRAENEILAAGTPVPLGPGWAHDRWQGHTHKRPKSGGPCRECGHVDGVER